MGEKCIQRASSPTAERMQVKRQKLKYGRFAAVVPQSILVGRCSAGILVVSLFQQSSK